MNLPESNEFFDEVRRAFSYLPAAGFKVADPEDYSLGAKIEFIGKNVAVSLSLDRKDPCIDCYVTRVVAGRLTKNDVSGGYWGPLHQFLIRRRKYRGGFKEFREGLDPKTWQSAVATYARALKALAPDIAADEAACLEPK